METKEKHPAQGDLAPHAHGLDPSPRGTRGKLALVAFPAHPGGESEAPTFRNVDITSGSKEIGPFTTVGVYHIYCTIHQGMNLTIVVQ